MSNLISTWSRNVKTIPDSYVFPPSERPGDHIVPICKSIPVINLALKDRCEAARQIVNASNEYGLFQVVNHGVSKNLMKETANLLEEFFDMSEEEKAVFYTDDIKSPSKLYTSSLMYSKDKVHAWKDTLQHNCNPLEEHVHNWPDKPARYREIVGEYTIAVKKMCSIIMNLIAEGLGLHGNYFEDKMTETYGLAVNYYPPCSDPSLVWGAAPHRDPSLITILQQNVYGLQIEKDGEWLGVELIPDAFVVNGGYQLEAITNGKLKSTLHRVMTNRHTPRMSLANLISPSFDSFIEPAKALINADNPPRYKSYIFGELMQTFFAHYGNTEPAMDSYKL